MTDHELYKNELDDCPLTHALYLIGGKWLSAISRSHG